MENGIFSRLLGRAHIKPVAVPLTLLAILALYMATNGPKIQATLDGEPVKLERRSENGPSKKPNVIILLADDMGMGDISLNNENGKIHTPNIDKIGLEGVNFLDAHAASTKCSPSRYGLMTGRHSFLNIERANLRALRKGTPHLADLFNRNGYRTGIVGKLAPINGEFEGKGFTEEEKKAARVLHKAHLDSLGGGTGIRGPGEHKESFYLPGNWSMPEGAHTYGYDYSFLNQYACCRVGGGFFENGVGTEPFNKFAIQRPYPEGSKQRGGPECQPYKSFDGEERCGDKPFANGYLGPPFFDERVNGPVLVPNFPPSVLVQESYDGRLTEQRVLEKGLNFIKDSVKQKEPFFLYYGFRSGHNPFNSPPELRGTTGMGEIGESTVEMDNNIGKVMDLVKELGIDDDTVVVFLSDNGAITRGNAVDSTKPYPDGNYNWDVFRHYQNSFTVDGVWYKFKAGKNSMYEGGHRLPMLWRYPKVFKPRVDATTHVSYLDVFRTLAEIIGDNDLPCNEAPDSKSMKNILVDGGTPEDKAVFEGPRLQHGVFQGTRAIRDGPWKLISGTKELFDLSEDLEELNNLYDARPDKVENLRAKLDRMVAKINERELRTDEGRLAGVC